MSTWRPRLADIGRSKHRDVAGGIATDVARGALVAGDNLHRRRRMAELIGLDVSTVPRGRAEAILPRLIKGFVGLWTCVMDSNTLVDLPGARPA